MSKRTTVLTLMLAAMMASAGTAAGQNPRPMTDVDNPARQPWVGKAHIQLPPNPGTLAISNSVDFEVPQGKRLVVEGFSGECSAQEGPYFEVGADVTTQNVRASHYFKLDRFPYLQTGNPRVKWIGTESARIYADPGSTVRAWFLRGGDYPYMTTCGMTFSGYFVDLPE